MRPHDEVLGMCNLYSVTKGQAAIRKFARAMQDTTGNLPPPPGICEYTDYLPKIPHRFDGEHRKFAFLTCEANDVVRPIHAKAMPVLLTRPEECDAWLSSTLEEAIPCSIRCQPRRSTSLRSGHARTKPE